ncbi:FG-GAP-like repeat-containing protein [Oryzihumus leptocrescens]|uniref:FG-GAP-like repeat-containing protein n=1 Tax=Oryzihumus leptocrescens TaxID=297536 RepID=UPI001639B145|nr:FG-GAP-like repeat-containing protein [Oryzihumus leptocrescens]
MLTALAAGLALVPVLMVGPTAHAATAVPPTPTDLPTAIEPLATDVTNNSCDGLAKPGTVALGNLLKATYPTSSYGTVRACGADSITRTEHYDGRALDWMVSVRNATQAAEANAVLGWLFATRDGVTFANARRLGVMYVIWNNQIWGTWSQTWEPYSSCASTPQVSMDSTCHRNHIHFSLSWAGAMKRTSYWTKQVAATDYGPCRNADLNWAPPYAGYNGTPCPRLGTVTAPAGATTLTRQLASYSGMYLRGGSTGPAVSAIQQMVGLRADGVLGTGTVTRLKTWQRAHGVAATGVADPITWRAAMISRGVPPVAVPSAPGFDADPATDLLARESDGRLMLVPGDGNGGLGTPTQIGSGWNMFDTITSPGDMDNDGHADLVARTPSGLLYLYRGNGQGGFIGWGTVIGRGWQVFSQVFTGGDFSGDGHPDVLARKPNGDLLLYQGNGRGGVNPGLRIGLGWQVFDTVVAARDVTGDGKADLLARKPSGQLCLYAGSGAGTVRPGTVVASGWDTTTTLLSAGDITGDRRADLLARGTDGTLTVLPGNGNGTFGQGYPLSTSWGAYTATVGVG